jgi:hypothetical protein
LGFKVERALVVKAGVESGAIVEGLDIIEDGGRNGIFGSQSITYDPSQGFTPSISYDTNHVYLDLTWNQ